MRSKEEELLIKKEIEALKRQDREETVMRIGKIQEYRKEKVLEKIREDDERANQVK